MSPALQQPTVCPVVIGRGAQLAALDTVLDTVAAGHGQTLALTGEAGIGKSRLVAELRTRAAARDMLVCEGRCFEPDRVVPYAPLRDLVRADLAQQTPEAITAALTPNAAQLARLLPELARFLSPTVLAAPSAPEQDRHLLAQALVQYITRRSHGRPALVIIEDLHWSDDASLDALPAFARGLAAQPIVLLLTYRSDEITPNLRHALALLDRERRLAEMTLPRLVPAEVDALLRAIFEQPQPIRAGFLQAICDLTDGNPFFIEEVIRSLIAGGDIFRSGQRWERRDLAQLQIPRSVQDAVLRRIARLSAEETHLLHLAAVAGRRFDFAVLQALTGAEEARLIALVQPLIAAQLVVEESADHFAFRHALTRQAIYTALLTRERRLLHRAIGEALEQLHATRAEEVLADLSDHFAAGEDWVKALEYGGRAGEQALALSAPRAATEHFTRALDAARHLAIAPPWRLHRQRGQALGLLGEFAVALADHQAALAAARSNDERRAEWQSLLDLGGLWAGYDYARAGEYLQQALALAREIDDPKLLAESLAEVGGWRLNTEQVDQAERSLQDALAIFERSGDRSGVARATDLLGTVSDIAGDIPQMRRRYERAAALYRDLGDQQGLSSTLATMLLHGGGFVFDTVVVAPGVAPDAVVAEATEALALARDIGWRAGEAYALLELAVWYTHRGQYGSALDHAREGLAIATEIEHGEWMTAGESTHGVIFAGLLAQAAADDHLSQAYALARASGSLHFVALTAALWAELRTQQGNHAGAGVLLASFAPDLPMSTLGQRRVWAARAALALAQGDSDSALAILDQLFSRASNLTSEGDIPLLALLRGRALAALDRHDEAEAALRAAIRGADARGHRPLVWRSHAALGRCYAAWARQEAAREEYRLAWEIVEELAATLPDGPLRAGFLAQVAQGVPREASRANRRHAAILTAREQDVAALVARGHSNREIAATLSIGERTVETHVSNILGKLAVTSRTQVADWVQKATPGHREV
ncbi:MAG: helix-turn-helix transcriptional regulator [Thermomicrobiales bacterium]